MVCVDDGVAETVSNNEDVEENMMDGDDGACLARNNGEMENKRDDAVYNGHGHNLLNP